MRNGHRRRGNDRLVRTLSARGGKIASEIQDFGRVAVNGAERAVVSLGETGKRVLRAASRGRSKVKVYVTRNPMRAALIALGAGAVIGFILRRRKV
jgi:hypothetical protein